jgi:predicted metal-binding membrane protein
MILALPRLDMRSLSRIAVFVVILLAWAVMFMMARMSGVDILGSPVGVNMMPMTQFGTLFGLWAIVMAAMMLPTMVPTLAYYPQRSWW